MQPSAVRPCCDACKITSSLPYICKATHRSLRRHWICNCALTSLSIDVALRSGNGYGGQYAGHEEFGPQQSSPGAGLSQNRNRFSSRPGTGCNDSCRQGLLHLTVAQQVENLQMVEEIFPLLLTFGEAAHGDDKAGSTEMAFAAILTQLQAAAVLLHQSTLLVVNLLSQLGALCSEQTRKSTVISGAHLQPINVSLQASSIVLCHLCTLFMQGAASESLQLLLYWNVLCLSPPVTFLTQLSSPSTWQEQALVLLSHKWLHTPDCNVFNENENYYH